MPTTKESFFGLNQTNSFILLKQFDPVLHSTILGEMKRVANQLIIVDYTVPLPKNYAGIGSRVAEFLAGIEHNRNFKKYYQLG